jgi:hypothetical protein
MLGKWPRSGWCLRDINLCRKSSRSPECIEDRLLQAWMYHLSHKRFLPSRMLHGELFTYDYSVSPPMNLPQAFLSLPR